MEFQRAFAVASLPDWDCTSKDRFDELDAMVLPYVSAIGGIATANRG